MKYILILLLVACGQQYQPAKKLIWKPSDPIFDELKWKFEWDFGLSAAGIAINLVPLGDNNVGECHYYNKYPHLNYILIHTDFWNKASDEEREQVVYHELVHCVGLVHYHIDTKIHMNGTDCPVSLMTTTQFNHKQMEKCYIPKREYYINQALSLQPGYL